MFLAVFRDTIGVLLASSIAKTRRAGWGFSAAFLVNFSFKKYGMARVFGNTSIVARLIPAMTSVAFLFYFQTDFNSIIKLADKSRVYTWPLDP